MSAAQYKKILEKEVVRINKKIDLLILKGQSYKDEARRHRELRMQLQRLQRPVGIFGRFFGHAVSY